MKEKGERKMSKIKLTKDEVEDLIGLLEDYLQTFKEKNEHEKAHKKEPCPYCELAKDFLKKFRNSEKAARVNYYLAECYYEIKEFDKAADEYYKVMTFYDDNDFIEDAAYNRILAYYQLVSLETPAKDSVVYYIEDFIGGGETIQPIKVGNEAQFKLLRACNDFVRQLPESDNLLEVLMKYAETLYELKSWDLAARIYKITVSPEYRKQPFYGESISMIAQCYLTLGKYADSEKWFNNLADAFPDSAE